MIYFTTVYTYKKTHHISSLVMGNWITLERDCMLNQVHHPPHSPPLTPALHVHVNVALPLDCSFLQIWVFWLQLEFSLHSTWCTLLSEQTQSCHDLNNKIMNHTCIIFTCMWLSSTAVTQQHNGSNKTFNLITHSLTNVLYRWSTFTPYQALSLILNFHFSVFESEHL